MVAFEDLTDEQQAAATTLDRNVTITAGAGTGKTTTLTERYMQMLAAGRDGDELVTPEHILTTTFTERAANELQASVREAITDRLAATDPATYEDWRTIADDLSTGYIHTLHGFCARLLREHAVSVTAVDPGFETLDEAETAALIDETVGTVLETHDDHPALHVLARRFTRCDLQAILTDLLAERPESITWAQQWVESSKTEYLEYVQSTLHPVDVETARTLLTDPAFERGVETLRELAAESPIEGGDTDWDRALDMLEMLDDAGVIDGSASDRDAQQCVLDCCELLTTGGGERYASYDGAKTNWRGHEAAKDRFGDAMTSIVDTLEPTEHLVSAALEVDANSYQYVQALAELLLVAADDYEDRKAQRNVVDFTDQIQYTLDFLADDDNAAIRAELREQFEYVMVDEFQDTDPRQTELIKLLTADDPATFDSQNVFVVGDEKQSIYRFRNADVTQFETTATELEAANPPAASSSDGGQLSTNFRTLPNVLHCINALFDEIFEAEADAPAFEAAPQPLAPERDNTAGIDAAVEYLCVPSDDSLRAHRFSDDHPFATTQPEHDVELEAMALAARLTHVLDEPYEVYPTDSDAADESAGAAADHGDEDETDARPIRPDDIAILLRSRTHLKKYERALDDHNIPYTVASGIGFYDTPEITALVNLFRALADPDNERALYGVLRSPLFGLTDNTLASLKQDADSLWAGLETTSNDDLDAAYDLLVSWRQAAGIGADAGTAAGRSWASLLTQIIDDTGYLVNISADERPQQTVANVEKFREQLRAWSEDGVTSLTSLVERIERRRELSDREGEADVPTDNAGVQILTVHDAKGMEFPFVVVPGLDRSFNDQAAIGNGKIEFEQIDGEPALGMKGPDPDEPYRQAQTIAREGIKRQRRAEERAEEKRVLYVACTRARDHLLLSGVHESEESDGEVSSLADLEAADADPARSWRDWVQPILFDDDLLATLDASPRVTHELGGGEYAVQLPPCPVDWNTASSASVESLDRIESPPQPARQFRVSPTDLASLVAGYGTLEHDAATQTIVYQSEDDTTAGENSDDEGGESLAPTLFGELVHRLCEVDPPASARRQFLRQVLIDEDADDTDLTQERIDRVSAHAERALSYLDERRGELDVQSEHDELHVTAEFEMGESSGLIDHLFVTPDAYHIVDYKTNDITADEVDGKGEYYRTQMAVYALALHQNDPTRSVTATLYFTAVDEPWHVEWEASALPSTKSELEDEIQYHITE
ncbi:UvrD-helicase domain-containing protein [Halomicrococcus sp. NG-SE-24]|uniref:UvrD-helicase domain-containing protein n=1 Tax=Halomicrococcus sp. NG-SE-24 TaxID=3436928 RepID=UPI003D988B30